MVEKVSESGSGSGVVNKADLKTNLYVDNNL